MCIRDRDRCVPNCGACCFFKEEDTGPMIECGKLKRIEKVFGPRKNFADKVGRKWFLKTVEDYDLSKAGVRAGLGGGAHVGACPCVFLDTSNGHDCKIIREVGRKFQPTTCKEWNCTTIGKKAQALQRRNSIDIGRDFRHRPIEEIVELLDKAQHSE